MSTAPAATADVRRLGPLAQLRAGRLARRLVQLYVGLGLYGASLAMMIRADLGVAPWDVLHSGLARHLPLSLGQALVAVSFLVLLAWLPLREVPGLGTISNAVVVGVVADLALSATASPEGLVVRAGLMLGGVALCGLASACYLGARLGAGPRDGLMTGLARRTGGSIRLVRTLLEVAVVLAGLVLGGRLGAGTVIFALGIGPVTQALMPRFWVRLAPER